MLLDGVLVAPQRAEAYVMSPDGSIDAVDTAAGRLLWQSRDAAKPLAVNQGLLVAQRDGEQQLGLATLDTRAGGALRGTAGVDLPTGTHARIDDGLGASFRAGAEVAGDEVIVSWQAEKTTTRGLIEGDGETQSRISVDKALAGPVKGAVRLDVATGDVAAVAADKDRALPRPRLELLTQERLAGVDGRQLLSADGRHVLTSERLGTEGVWQKYRWTIYQRETGEQLGRVDSNISLTSFVVADSRLLYATQAFLLQRGEETVDEPLKLRAIDLASGQEVWSREIRETRYQGVTAP